MSAQKLLAEADKLLEKGKTAEAVAKIKSAVAAEPTNQLIVTKLVELFLNLGKVAEAAQAYVQLAERLSDSGKSQVAVAVYKKALDVIPTDFNLRSKYVLECERAGKLGEAYAGAQDLLSHLLPRKKYFEALNIFVIINRVQARDPNYRALWLDLLLKTQSEQKLIHFLVAIFGPPGIASPEIPTGGDPLEMSADFYQRCKEIISWFPRDTKAAYGLAWAAYKRGETREAYRFLHECIRRDPDYTLGYLLFARILSENKFLNECMYVYQQAKDSLSIDHSGDPLLVNQQVESFIEKNGWLSFAVGIDPGDMTPEQFLQKIKGENQAKAEEPESKTNGRGFSSPSGLSGGEYDPTKEINVPAEIELNLGSSSEESFEFESNRAVKENKTILAAPKVPLDDENTSVDFTSIIKVNSGELKAKPNIDTELAKEIIAKVEEVISSTSAASKRQFNPMDDMPSAPSQSAPLERNTGTIQYNPMDAIRATTYHKEIVAKNLGESKPPSLPSAVTAKNSEPTAEIPNEPPVFVDGEKTVLFSPIEAFSAIAESQKNRIVATPSENIAPSLPTSSVSEDATSIMAPPKTLGIQEEDEGKTIVGRIELPPISVEEEIQFRENSVAKKTEEAAPPELQTIAPTQPMVEPIAPINAEIVSAPAQEEASVDMGTDLLQEPTRVLVISEEVKKQAEQIKEEPKELDNGALVKLLMERSQKYLIQQNYYLARKALHNARLLGADDATIKLKLKEVRLAEMPNGMYAAVSSDSGKLANKLTLEETALFEYLEPGDESQKLSKKGNQDATAAIEALIHSVDAKSLMDLGIGFFEMGLYEGAERLFERIIEAEPSESFNVYFLMGQAAMSRGDHARAVSIFKKLASDPTKTEKEKISIYYSLGEVLEKMEQLGRSKSYFEKVAELDANYRNVKEKISG